MTHVSKPWTRQLVAVAFLCGALGACDLLCGDTTHRLTTDEGELIVQVDDPNVDVTVKKQSVLVNDRNTKREYVLTAREGEVGVDEQASGLALTTRKFTLNRSGKDYVSAAL